MYNCSTYTNDVASHVMKLADEKKKPFVDTGGESHGTT